MPADHLNIDLHSHTTRSDGMLSPTALVAGKLLAVWLVSALPLVIITPLLALALAVVQFFSGIWGAHRTDGRLMQVGHRATVLQMLMMLLAFGCLAWSFVHFDFSLKNVASNSNRMLPLPYRIAATWGSHEGSMLLWALMLSGGAGCSAACCARRASVKRWRTAWRIWAFPYCWAASWWHWRCVSRKVRQPSR